LVYATYYSLASRIIINRPPINIHQLYSIKNVSLKTREEKIKAYVTRISAEGLLSTQRQARKLISGPIQTAKTRLLLFNRTQSKVVPGLLREHIALRRHLYLMGLTNIPLCRKCGVEEETSAHVLSECEILALLRPAHLCSSFLDPEDVKSLRLGAIWNSGLL
jgi:hypothetical protein